MFSLSDSDLSDEEQLQKWEILVFSLSPKAITRKQWRFFFGGMFVCFLFFANQSSMPRSSIKKHRDRCLVSPSKDHTSFSSFEAKYLFIETPWVTPRFYCLYGFQTTPQESIRRSNGGTGVLALLGEVEGEGFNRVKGWAVFVVLWPDSNPCRSAYQTYQTTDVQKLFSFSLGGSEDIK